VINKTLATERLARTTATYENGDHEGRGEHEEEKFMNLKERNDLRRLMFRILAPSSPI